MDPPRPRPDCPLVVAYGLGVNSTAMLIEFVKREITPDMILFADTGGEKPETYAYLPVIQDYLKRVVGEARSIVIVGGKRVPVCHKEKTVVRILQLHPVLQCPHIVPQMQLARGAHAA